VAWKFVYCECCVLSGRGLCDKLISRPEESCRMWCGIVWSRKPQEWGDHDPRWVAAPQKKSHYCHKHMNLYCMCTVKGSLLLTLSGTRILKC